MLGQKRQTGKTEHFISWQKPPQKWIGQKHSASYSAWQELAGFHGAQQKPFRRGRFCKFVQQKQRFFYNCIILVFLALRKQDDFCWKLNESRMASVESSTKAGWLSSKVLRKRDDFRWKLYKSRMTKKHVNRDNTLEGFHTKMSQSYGHFPYP